MPVSAADLTELRRLEATITPDSGSDLSTLELIAEVIAWVITEARAAGDNEVDRAETLIRFSNMTPDEVRTGERVLRRLGYRAVADMMRRIAGRTRRDLKPL